MRSKMKIVVFESDHNHLDHLKEIFGELLSKDDEVIANPDFPLHMGNDEESEYALFLVDTRYKMDDGNFLTLARNIRESSEKYHICFMSPSAADMGFCLKKLVRPSAFLLKPVDVGEISQLIHEINAFTKLKNDCRRLPELVIETKHGTLVLDMDNVLYFTSYNKKVFCYEADGSSISFYGSLSSIEDDYGKYFVRCHYSYLVNKNKIALFSKRRMILKVSGIDEEIPVSKGKIGALMSISGKILTN